MLAVVVGASLGAMCADTQANLLPNPANPSARGPYPVSAALLPGGYRYPDGLPTSLPPDRMAAHQPAPPFEGEPPPTPRVSPAVRAAWAEALAELERRDESRQGAHAIGIAGAGAMIGGAAAAMLCSVQ